jgi:hypothetical protein
MMPFTQQDHDEAAAIGGAVLLVATIALVVGTCAILML